MKGHIPRLGQKKSKATPEKPSRNPIQPAAEWSKISAGINKRRQRRPGNLKDLITIKRERINRRASQSTNREEKEKGSCGGGAVIMPKEGENLQSHLFQATKFRTRVLELHP